MARYAGTPHEARALDAYLKLVRAAQTVAARAHRHLALEKLTFSQFAALDVLFHLGPMCQRDLGQKLLRSGGNVTLVVDNLGKRNLVTRKRVPDNRRMMKVELTPAGRRLLQRLLPRHVEAVVAEMSVLTPTEQEDLGRLCRRVGRRE
jgi:MarR family 2-MHQ and catechol resistance regulon transcriptional repressor